MATTLAPAIIESLTALTTETLAHHGLTITEPTLAWACLDCGSVGTVADPADRDDMVDTFDFTCCATTDTVTFTRTGPHFLSL